ncbi:MAG: hypothetical protein RLZZ175_2731 [Bacteroidota bacterium]|jgi:PAS domain S-box-containing protein
MPNTSKNIRLLNELTQMFSELEQQKIALDYSAIVAITDIKGNIIYVNDKFCIISKYSKEELLGKNHRILNSGTHDKLFFKELWKTISRGKVWSGEIKNKAKDGSYYWVHTTIVPYLNEENLPFQYVSIRFDITQKKEQQEKLVQQKIALDSAAIVAITDVKGEITYINDKFCKISKYSKNELLGQNHRIINSGYHEKDFFQNLWSTISKGQIWTGDIKNKAKDGTYYWVSTTIIPYLNDMGKPIQYVSIRFDITKQKQQEEELKNRAKLLEDFCFIVSHNLRAPISNLPVLVSMIQNCDTFEKQKEIASKLSKPVNVLLETFNELVESLHVRNDVNIQTEYVDFFECYNLALENLCIDTYNFEIEILHDFSLITSIYYSKKYLKSYFINLISNAIKYRDPNRKLKIIVKTKKINNSIQLSVEDNGLGIDMKKYGDKLFGLRKTFHENPEAKGFGLFITKTQVESLGGSIMAVSEPNEGSTFIIKFN